MAMGVAGGLLGMMAAAVGLGVGGTGEAVVGEGVVFGAAVGLGVAVGNTTTGPAAGLGLGFNLVGVPFLAWISVSG